VSISLKKQKFQNIFIIVKKNGFEVFLEIEEDDYKYDREKKYQ
jgi:hypothetical protein